MSFRVLIVDDDPTVRQLLHTRLERKGYTVALAENGQDALKIHKEFKSDVLVCDLRMPGLSGFEVLQQITVPTIIITGHGDKESAIEAVEKGAFAFFEKPFDLSALEFSIRRAGERHNMMKEREELLKKLSRLCRLQDRELETTRPHSGESELVGHSAILSEVRRTLSQLAKKPKAPLLILGETGTGKEVAAKELHRLSFNEPQTVPFLPLNCATVPQELFESELFGHEKGSFTGAQNTRVGLAEAVREGTLFLDEIGEMTAQHQAKLLRFLQEKTFRRVGSNKEIPFRGRVGAATHRDLKQMVEDGKFREDLLYRLNLVIITLPALRNRKDDITEVAEALCKRHGLKGVRDPLRLSSYEWPGNVRELNNWIERASILDLVDQDGLVHASLPEESSSSQASGLSLNVEGLALSEKRQKMLDEFDARWIQEALDKTGGVVSKAAEVLNIDRKNLQRRIKELGLKKAS